MVLFVFFVFFFGRAGVWSSFKLNASLLQKKKIKNYKLVVKILSLRQHEIAPVGVSFVTSVEKEC